MIDPFAALGIAPTRELAVVKRAWFTSLPRHPPETDPEGFRRLRDAYEQLSKPGALAAAFAAAPVDVASFGAQYAARFDAAIEASGRSMASQPIAKTALQQFVDRFSGQPWEETVRSLAG